MNLNPIYPHEAGAATAVRRLDLVGIRNELVFLQVTGLGKKQIMHIPELALCSGREGCFISEGCVGMKSQGIVLKTPSDVASVGIQDLLYHRRCFGKDIGGRKIRRW